MLMTITPGYRARLQRLGHLTKNTDQNSMRPLLLSILGTGESNEWQDIAELSRAAVAEALRGQRVSGRWLWAGTTAAPTDRCAIVALAAATCPASDVRGGQR